MTTTAGLYAVVQHPAAADHETVTAVRGSAYGYSLDVFLFAAQQPPQGPTPTVTLAPGGSNSPQTASAPTGDANVSPAQFFSSGPITLTTSGALGPAGGVTSTTEIVNVNTSRYETFGEDHLNPQIEPGTDPARPPTSVSSSCTASTAGVSGSTTIINGKLYLDSGKFVNNDPDYDDPGEHPPVIVTVPVNPAPNTTYGGHVHIGSGTAVDNFRYVFNEQVRNPDGSLTVNAGHQYLVGPIAKGDLIFGQSVCGVTTELLPPSTTVPPTTVPPTTTPPRPPLLRLIRIISRLLQGLLVSWG